MTVAEFKPVLSILYVLHCCHSGSMHMSPGVLASMWKEAEAKTKILEDKMKVLLKEKGVS